MDSWFVMFFKAIICLSAALFSVFISVKTNWPGWLKMSVAISSAVVISYLVYTLIYQLNYV